MNLIQTRERFSDPILERRFIKQTLQDAGTDIDKAQQRLMSSRGFESNDWYSGRSFIASGDSLEYTHLSKHRFVDMKSRTSSKGTLRKKNHPVHNRIIWGHYNNIIKELHFGFTHAVQEQLRQIQD